MNSGSDSSSSLLNSVKGLITPGLINKMSSALNESPDRVSKGTMAAIPAFLSGIVERGSTIPGAEMLISLIKREGLTKTPTSGEVEQVFENTITGPSHLSQTGPLDNLFGGNWGSLAGMIASYSGLRMNSARSILSTCGSMIMGVLGGKVSSAGFGPSDLARFLSGQKESVAQALPQGLSTALLGAGGLAGISTMAGPNRQEQTSSRPREKSHKKAWIVAASLAGLALLGGIFWNRNQPVREVQVFQSLEQKAGQEDQNREQTPTDQVNETRAAVDERANEGEAVTTDHTPGGNAAGVAADTAAFDDNTSEALRNFLAQERNTELPKRFSVQGLNFEFGTTHLIAESRGKIEDIAQVLKDFPNARIALEGHTDNIGGEESNLLLSLARAETVRDLLLENGVQPGQILNVEGLGSTKPLAANDTEENRLQNRRIDIVVKEK